MVGCYSEHAIRAAASGVVRAPRWSNQSRSKSKRCGGQDSRDRIAQFVSQYGEEFIFATACVANLAVSRTRMTTSFRSFTAVIQMWPPGSVYFTAFLSKLH